MIIRRVIEALREQEWGIVIVELLVVVVGIFLGLQASNWNEDRKLEAEGYFYLDLLRRQLTEEIRRDEQVITIMTEANTRLKHVVTLLFAESWTKKEFQQFKEQHWAVYSGFGDLRRPHASKQLLDLGRIDLIRSRQIQEKLFEFDAAYESVIQQNQVSNHYVTEAVTTISMGISYGTSEDLMAIPASPEDFLENSDLKSAIRIVYTMNGFQLDALNQLQDSRREMRDELETYLSAQSYLDFEAASR